MRSMALLARFLLTRSPLQATRIITAFTENFVVSLAQTRDSLQQPGRGAIQGVKDFSDFDREASTCSQFHLTFSQQHGSNLSWEALPYLPFCAASSGHAPSQFQSVRLMSDGMVKLDTSGGVARFDVGERRDKDMLGKDCHKKGKKKKKSKKAMKNELRFFRLKAKKKLKSSNPEVRIKYKLEKAKRKEAWLIEKLLKYEMPKAPAQRHDPEPLTAEERFYLKRIGQKHKHYVPVGRRGVFGGVILNMHLHWKKHETVKVICKPCKPGQIHEYAEEIARLSGGIVIDIKGDNTVVFYRGKNYVRPEVMSPRDTLSKKKALDKYRFQQSLESVGHFIETLEKELDEYHKHVAMYGKPDSQNATTRSAKEHYACKVNFVDDCFVQDNVNNPAVNGCGMEDVSASNHCRSLIHSTGPLSDALVETEEDDLESCGLDIDPESEGKTDFVSLSETEKENLEYFMSDMDFNLSMENVCSSSDLSQTEDP